MPRNQRKDQLLREERRQQILEAAARIFARRGMLTKISDIAAGAKLSQGHVYNYFKSKDEILLAVIEQGQLGYGVVLRETISMPGSAEDKFRCLAERPCPAAEARTCIWCCCRPCSRICSRLRTKRSFWKERTATSSCWWS